MCEHNFIIDNSHPNGYCRCTNCNTNFPLGMMVKNLQERIVRIEKMGSKLNELPDASGEAVRTPAFCESAFPLPVKSGRKQKI